MSLSNAVESTSLSNYLGEAAITMLFGMGYYVVNKMSKSNEDKKKSETKEETTEILSTFHLKIKENTSKSAFELLSSMNELKLLPTIETYNLLIFNSYKNGFYSDAKKLRDQIFDNTFHLKPDCQTFNLILKGTHIELFSEFLSKNKDIKHYVDEETKEKLSEISKKFDLEYQKIKLDMKNRGFEMQAETENIYIDILVDQNRLEEALNHFEKVHKNIQFDLYTYTICLRIYKTLLNNYHYNTKTTNFSKNNSSKNEIYEKYNSKINYIRNLVDEKMKEYLSKHSLSHKEGISRSDYETFIATLLDTFIALRDNEQAKNAFSEYKPKDEGAYVSMIRIYTLEKNLKKALDVFTSLKNEKKLEGKTASISGYGAILNACAKLGNMKLAELILSEMFKNGIQPNSYVYSTVINGYKLAQRLDLAIEAYKLAEKDEENLSIAVVNTILNSCADEGKYDILNEIFDKSITDEKVIPDKITFSIMIKAYAKHRETLKLWDLYYYLLKNKIYDEITFNSLLDAFANQEHESNLYEIYSEMKKNQINISIVTYGVILKLYVNQANRERCEEIYREIILLKLMPTMIIFQLMIKLYSYLGFTEKVWEIYENMTKIFNMTPDAQLFESLIRICLKSNLVYKVKDLLKHALNSKTHVENYLYEAFLTKISYSEISKEEKCNLVNEVTLALSERKISLDNRCYQIIEDISKGRTAKKNYQSNNNQKYNNYNNKYYKNQNYYNKNSYGQNNDYYYDNDQYYYNESKKESTNKFDVKENNLEKKDKERFKSLNDVFGKKPNTEGKSIYN